MLFRHKLLFAGLAVSTTLSFACKSKLTGNEGNLTFSYVADENFRDFNKPIAVGAKLDLQVETAGNPATAAQVETAESDDTGILDVVTFSGNTITVEGQGDGNVLLNVTADAGGTKGVLSDSVNLTVRVPQVQELTHTCTEEANGLYLVGQEIWVPFELKMTNGQDVIGYGYYPVTPVPTEGLAMTNAGTEIQFLKFMTADTAQAITLESDIDDTVWNAELVEKAAIDGAELITDYPAFVDARTLYYVLPTVGGARVCQAITDFSVVSDTPDVCTVELDTPNNTSLTSATNEYGWIAITGSQVDVCQFTITYPEGGGGAGTSVQLQADIIAVETPTP